ncbi:MAG: hypothetical protein AB9917_10735 [Negativicutes bacterium]
MKRIHSLRRLFPKTSQVLLSATLILLLALVAGCGAVGADPAKHQAIEADTKAGGNVFEVVKETYADRAISINYPQISKMNDVEKQRRLNQILKADALSVLKDYSASDLEKLTVKLDYVIGRQSSELLSVQFIGSRFLKGTPYPTALFQSINLELQAGRKLRLQDSIYVNDQFVEAMKKGRMTAAKNVTLEKLRLDNGKLLKTFTQADSVVSSENPERAFSYFTKDGMGISFNVIHALGDHVALELPMAALSSFIKPEKANVIK